MNEGVLAAAAVVAGGYFALNKAGVFNGDDEAENKCNKDLPTGNDNKLTDQSAIARATAMMNYSCKYFQAVRTSARTNLIISLIQQAAAFYIADKQHDVAKQAQNRFDEIWQNQKDKADKFFNHWYDNSRPIELAMLNEARDREQAGYTVDYATAMNRSTARSRSEFSRARAKVARETPIHCVGARRTAIRQLYIAEAKAAVWATNSAIRFEEERKYQHEVRYREELKSWTQIFHNYLAHSNSALSTAANAARAAGSIDPYAGWTSSLSLMNSIGTNWNAMNMANFSAGQNAPALFASGYF